jgi:arylsulfatase A-like enzyme
VIDIDSMNADWPWAEEHGRPVAPALRRLADEGVVFPHLQSQGAWTLPAVVSLLTGAWPPPSEVAAGTLPLLAPGEVLLPDVLEAYGYHTTALWGRTIPADFAALGAAFDTSLGLPAGETGFDAQLDGWLEGPPAEPFFTFLHQVDLFRPEPAPPDAWLHRHQAAAAACARGTALPERLFWRLQEELGPAAALEHFRGHLLGTLAWYDASLERLLAGLTARGLDRRTVVVVLSNHGDDLLEHGVLGHNAPFQTVLEVPLILRDPASRSQGLRLEQRVRTVDVAPTLLARAGIPPAASMVGRSLLPLIADPTQPWPDEPAFSLTNQTGAALVEGDLKLLRWRPWSDRAPHGPEVRGALATGLFDLAADPGERLDLSGRHPNQNAVLGARLDAWLAERAAQARGGAAEPVTPALERTLREGGYWEVVQPAGEAP